LPRVLVVANDPAPWAALGVEVVPDRFAKVGPLGGIHAALAAADDCDAVVCLAGDLPFVTPALIAALRDRAPGADAVAPRTAGGIEPLCARYARAVFPSVDARVRAGELAVHTFLQGGAVDWIRGRGVGGARSRRAQLLQREHAGGSPARRRDRRPRRVMSRRAAAAAAAALLVVVAVPLFAATTFHGDDFLSWRSRASRRTRSSAFVSDAHGGEYYRPLPMLVWWLLGRPGGGSAPFAALALRCTPAPRR
jgi:hypothetical protein